MGALRDGVLNLDRLSWAFGEAVDQLTAWAAQLAAMLLEPKGERVIAAPARPLECRDRLHLAYAPLPAAI